jgi:hypothetical protein
VTRPLLSKGALNGDAAMPQGVSASANATRTGWRRLYMTAVLECETENYRSCANAAKETINSFALSEKGHLSLEEQMAMENALDVLNAL